MKKHSAASVLVARLTIAPVPSNFLCILCVLCTLSVLCVLPYSIVSAQHQPKTHRLEATPATVAYGYYWSEAKPVLRIASGDIVDVDTLLTNTPTGLQRAGVPEDKIQKSLQAIVSEVTGDRRRPRRAGRRRSRSDRRRNVAARPAAAHRAEGHETGVAACGDVNRLHQHGRRRGSEDGDDGRRAGDGGLPRRDEEIDEARSV